MMYRVLTPTTPFVVVVVAVVEVVCRMRDVGIAEVSEDKGKGKGKGK